MELTLALIKPTVCAFQPHILHAVRSIQAHPSLDVGVCYLTLDSPIHVVSLDAERGSSLLC